MCTCTRVQHTDEWTNTLDVPFQKKLPNGWCVVDRIIALDRGYDKLINWLISIGFDILHTKQRSPDFIFTFGLPPNSKLKGRVNIPEQGEMGAYWAKKQVMLKHPLDNVR